MINNGISEIENYKKKLFHRSLNRGSKETDIIFSNFAKNHLEFLSFEQLQQFEQILNIEDVLIMDWFFKRKLVPSDVDSKLLEKIFSFKK